MVGIRDVDVVLSEATLGDADEAETNLAAALDRAASIARHL